MAANSFEFTRPLNLQNLEDVAQWAEEVLTQIESVLNRQQKVIELVTLHAEPEKVYDGQIVVADGTNWDPGDGAGVYHRRGGSWVHLG